MDAPKRGRGRPRGQGPFGALRARLAQLAVGESAYIMPGDLTERARETPAKAVGMAAWLAARDIGSAKFSLLNLDGTVFVRRVA